VDLAKLVLTLWEGRFWIVTITGVIVLATSIYALMAREWYSAEVVLAPAAQNTTPTASNQLGNLGSLASIAGITRRADNSAEPLAVLRSREFIGSFIDDNKLLPVLAAAQPWYVSRELIESDRREGVQFFVDYAFRSSQDIDTGLVTVVVEWVDPDLAAEWANELVRRLNQRMRERALRENELNVGYLKQELAATNLVTMQQAVGRVLEAELQKGMMARVNEEFAFRVLDPAEAPKYRVRPRRTQMAAFAGVVGVVVSSVLVLLGAALKRSKADRGRHGA
jgi:LPS O-antigen subunit length determinant protein (WzzB/FepE family)